MGKPRKKNGDPFSDLQYMAMRIINIVGLYSGNLEHWRKSKT